MLATIEPFHGNMPPRPGLEVVTYSGSGDKWSGRTVIDKTLNYGHTLVSVDLDGDGARRTRGGLSRQAERRERLPARRRRYVVQVPSLEENAMPGSGCTVADFNNDKRMDFACTGGSTPTEVVREPAGQVILASRSPRRAELLTAAGISFEVLAADIDETPHANEAPAAYVERLAIEKARAVFALRPGAGVLGADTTVTIDGEILGKPVDEADALRMLRLLNGRAHDVHTGVASSAPRACDRRSTRRASGSRR